MKVLFLLLLGITAAFAGETTATHRITGLFSPERESDLRAAIEQIPNVKLVRIDFEHAEAVFTYDPAVAFKGTKPEAIAGRFNELLRNVSHSTLSIAPLEPVPKEELTRIEIAVAGLDCKACALAAYESIYKIDGVAAATVSFKEGRIAARIDPRKTGRPALESALKKRGVDVKP
jgi:copper chaperone CopZ